MPRKIAIVLAAIIVPGGLIALFGAALYQIMQRSQRGRQVIEVARRNAPSLPAYFKPSSQRQAA